jgi:hypothetical protein
MEIGRHIPTHQRRFVSHCVSCCLHCDRTATHRALVRFIYARWNKKMRVLRIFRIVKDSRGQKLGYFYYEEEPGRRSAANRQLATAVGIGSRLISRTRSFVEQFELLKLDEAGRIAA